MTGIEVNGTSLETVEVGSGPSLVLVHGSASDHRTWQEFLGSGFAPLTADAVRAVRAPALLLVGDRSPSLFHRVLDRLEELLPQSERVTIPGASHIQHEDNPFAYNTAVLSFLREHNPGPD